ncbi:hypothetical protein C0216_32910 (plasmid) [Streptomyces globosus]|uniref:Uncharacterized protein n=1 Tax=Streptomyces globosus TaxID=68209 RepID=A0A344UBK3_9ACTN|nr:hypothetical protein [Streptomyces globosus]AXE28274.1 hypothetical protein C0216_32910 [Streptomyces globosus]
MNEFAPRPSAVTAGVPTVHTVAQITAELGLQGRKPPRRQKNLTRQGKRKAARDVDRPTGLLAAQYRSGYDRPPLS